MLFLTVLLTSLPLLCPGGLPMFVQASSQSMPWLADLVQSSEGSLDVLPVQCLCEFLLHDAADNNTSADDEEEGESKEQKAKKRQVPYTVLFLLKPNCK